MNIDDLKFNSTVLNGFQFVEQNPLGFFEFDDVDDREKVFNNKVLGFQANGKIIVKENGFKPIKDDKGNNIASKDLMIVTRAKSRPVLIFQDIEFCKQYHNNVFIIPIQSLKKPIESDFQNHDEYVKRLDDYIKIKDKSHDQYNLYYIPKKTDTGVWERALILNDARFVHISTLYGQIEENQISQKDINEISVRLSKMTNITSKNDCDKCEYFRMFEAIKKVMNRVERFEKNA